MALTFYCGEIDRPDVRALLDQHFAAMRAASPASACHVLPADGLRDPAVTLWAASDGGVLAGVGALKTLAADHGEVKSMRVAPPFLGQGVGRALLDTIIAEARVRGHRRLSLETGNSAEFAAAIALHERAGFDRCAPFADYRPTPFTLFMSRPI